MNVLGSKSLLLQLSLIFAGILLMGFISFCSDSAEKSMKEDNAYFYRIRIMVLLYWICAMLSMLKFFRLL
jgi:hypothetical protein